MTDTFASAQDVLDALDTAPRSTVYVGGVTIEDISWDAQYDVDGLATAKIAMSLPRPAAVTANAAVEAQGGHNDFVGTLFSGRIPSWQHSMGDGNTLDVRAVGWSSLLTYRSRFDLVFDGPITIRALFDALCARYGVPSYVADTVTDPTGSFELTLGGNPQVEEGKVIIRANQTPLSYLRTATAWAGYRVYDTPTGTVRLSRFSGLPTGEPVVTFTEGVQIIDGSSSYDIGGIVNYPDIQGPTFEDEYGASIPIRAFPATVPSNPLIPVNAGVSYQDSRNGILVTQQMAEVALVVAQNDGAAPATPVRWTAPAVPGVSVGDVVRLVSPTLERNGLYWLQGMDITDNGAMATYDGWAGAGIAMPAGNNRTVSTVQTAPVHLGNETLTHYAVPAPSGTAKTWNITVPERATAVNVRGIHHGTNSQVLGGVQTEIEVTKWQAWPTGTTNFKEEGENRPIASGNMPSVPEYLSSRLAYNPNASVTFEDGSKKNPIGYYYWSPFAINLGRLEAADYVLRLVSGEKAGPDDFEVANVTLEVYGVAEPIVIPQEVQ